MEFSTPRCADDVFNSVRVSRRDHSGVLVRPVTMQEQKTKSLMRTTFPVFIFVLTFALALTIPRLQLRGKVENGLVLLLPLAAVFCFWFPAAVCFRTIARSADVRVDPVH